ncbi:RidA family protein [Bacillus horti]|uniref:Enamine deaminase RidA (YjgF/YER057c/UK114 family) n=1 Tax=Caldalkalibacillus horti TaxID=77523 RepID=A0ABT9W0S0_9BACI|nr:RidA family protein [Bacillus horti]MDQ0166455.1 enamine deaminase RidA (YjgF/YER057c/UK114 family) [Bacillus horti]
MNNKITRTNPVGVSAPVGNYTHITRIPKGADLFVTSGQIGTDLNGQIPSTFNEQVSHTFTNIKRVLESEQLTSKDIIKVNVWSTEKIDWDFFYAEWDKLFDTAYPAMTIAYIVELGLPEIKIEIEIWAAQM